MAISRKTGNTKADIATEEKMRNQVPKFKYLGANHNKMEEEWQRLKAE